MTGTVRAYKLLANYDVNSVEYIKAYANMPKVKKIVIDDNASGAAAKADGNAPLGGRDTLMHAVLNGLKTEGAQCTEDNGFNGDCE